MWGIKVSLTIHIETDRLLNPNREAGNKKKTVKGTRNTKYNRILTHDIIW